MPQQSGELQKMATELSANREPLRRDVLKTLHAALVVQVNADAAFWTKDYYNELLAENKKLYNTHLYNEGIKKCIKSSRSKAGL